MKLTLKDVGIGILVFLIVVFMFGYPIIISSFFLPHARVIIRIGLYIAFVVSIVALLRWLISLIVKKIKASAERK